MQARLRASRAATALALATALLGAAPPSAAAPTGEELLKKAVVADDRVSYTGTIATVVYSRSGADATVVRVDHAAPDEWRMWYVAPADAYGRLIISDETTTYQYEPKTATVYDDDWSQSRPGVAADLDVARVLKNYTVRVGAATDVAGRKAFEISLSSKYTGALVERLWVDATDSLVLQRETFHADGTIESKTGFDVIRIGGDIPKGLFDLSVPAGMHIVAGASFGKATKDVAGLGSQVGFTAISPSYLPNGFALAKAALSDTGGVKSIQLVYSDGLRDFSVFENQSQRLPDMPSPQAMDVGSASGITATLLGETVLSWNAGGLNLTMVGDLEAGELAKIGASIAP